MKHSLDNTTQIFIDSTQLESILLGACQECGIEQSVHVRIVENSEIQALNARFRHVDEPTDVLTFPSGLEEPFPAGDIAISVDYASEQARVRGVELSNELSALIIHGVLHICGYDDENEADQREMQLAMKTLGDKLQVPIDAEWTSVLHQYQK